MDVVQLELVLVSSYLESEEYIIKSIIHSFCLTKMYFAVSVKSLLIEIMTSLCIVQFLFFPIFDHEHSAFFNSCWKAV